LIRNFAERSAGAYQPSPGVLYPLLTMLADMDLVEQVEAPSGAGSRRDFRLTAAGEAEIAANSVAIEALFARLGALADVANRMDGGPVRRAVHNLRVALTERLARPGTSDEIAFEVARIIDEATQKIERL
ncbi:MAG TPA: helix-turn-helix transcriptional regulator, partial [Novosphingobium sp.]|nr:helix-turn-helix transcriptional regulator [Novosphingobium sp.]